MTKTSYQIEAHAYTENTPCGSPETCTDRKHWRDSDYEDIKNLATAREYAKSDDAPAVRIIKVVRTESREVIAG
jgi:hypothetical protein